MFRHRTVAGMAPSSRYLEKECPPILEMTSEKCVTAFAERTAITSGRARRAPNRMAAGQCCSATLLPHSRRSVRGSTPRWSPPLCSAASLPNLESTHATLPNGTRGMEAGVPGSHLDQPRPSICPGRGAGPQRAPQPRERRPEVVAWNTDCREGRLCRVADVIWHRHSVTVLARRWATFHSPPRGDTPGWPTR
jgi:hypothetical protein